MNNQIYYILTDMSVYLSMTQMKHLQGILIEKLEEVNEDLVDTDTSNNTYLAKFIAAKSIEGCSERTIQYQKEYRKNAFNNCTTN